MSSVSDGCAWDCCCFLSNSESINHLTGWFSSVSWHVFAVAFIWWLRCRQMFLKKKKNHLESHCKWTARIRRRVHKAGNNSEHNEALCQRAKERITLMIWWRPKTELKGQRVLGLLQNMTQKERWCCFKCESIMSSYVHIKHSSKYSQRIVLPF